MGRLAEMADLGRGAHVGVLLFAAFALANCASTDRLVSTSSPSSSSKYSAKMVEEGAQVPKGGGRYSVGKPYSINGQTYVPTEDTGYRVEGVASWYGPDFHGRQTANGEVYDMHSISAAHPTMPLPSYARVTNLDNGRSIVVRVNDRGPYARNRVIDMSIGAAKALEFYGYGLARVRVEYVGRAPLEGSDDRMLMATLRSGSPAPAPSRIMVASAAPSVFGAGGPSGQVARLPPERPFTLGMPGAGATFPGSPSNRTAEREPRVEAVAPRSAQARSVVKLPNGPADSDIPALASPRLAATSAALVPANGTLGLMSGRGLY
jgi:rare lipoprotein A